jgi:hypothetical protein
MWSSMSMRFPDLKEVSMPPAAFVTITVRQPRRPRTRAGKTTDDIGWPS